MADFTRIQIRRDSAADWTSNDPTLTQGEIGYETDTNYVKIGDGSTAWTSLDYIVKEGKSALSDGANIATDASNGNIFTVTLGGNRTLDNPTNTKIGESLTWIITQDGTGGRTLAFGTDFDFQGSTNAIDGTASSITVIQGIVVSTSSIRCSIIGASDKGSFALTDGANIATDCSRGRVFTATLGGNRTLDNPTNKTIGESYTWIITQDGTGGRTLAFGTDFDFIGNGGLDLTAGNISVIKGTVLSSSSIRCEWQGATAISSIVWRMVNNESNGDQNPLGASGSDWEISDDTLTEDTLGSSTQVTESSGIFSFGSTGYWFINYHGQATDSNQSRVGMQCHATENNGGAWTDIANAWAQTENGEISNCSGTVLLKIADISNDKIKFLQDQNSGNGFLQGSGTLNATYVSFTKLSEL
jgi:phosphohistidine swiveling domain-containing protein